MAFAFFSVLNRGLSAAAGATAKGIGRAAKNAVTSRTAGATWDSVAAGAILRTKGAVDKAVIGSYRAAQATASGARAAGRSARAAGNAFRWMPGGNRLNWFEDVATAGRPYQLNFALQRRAMGLVAGAGAAAGLYSAAANNNKNVPAYMSKNGNLEIAAPMGASGDLALSMHKNARGNG